MLKLFILLLTLLASLYLLSYLMTGIVDSEAHSKYELNYHLKNWHMSHYSTKLVGPFKEILDSSVFNKKLAYNWTLVDTSLSDTAKISMVFTKEVIRGFWLYEANPSWNDKWRELINRHDPKRGY